MQVLQNTILKILEIEQVKYAYKVLNNHQKKNNRQIQPGKHIHNHDTKYCSDIAWRNVRTNITLHNPFNEAQQEFNRPPVNIKNILLWKVLKDSLIRKMSIKLSAIP